MTLPLKNLDQVYHKVTPHENSLKRLLLDIGIIAGEVACLLIIMGAGFAVLQCGVEQTRHVPLFGADVQREIIDKLDARGLSTKTGISAGRRPPFASRWRE